MIMNIKKYIFAMLTLGLMAGAGLWAQETSEEN